MANSITVAEMKARFGYPYLGYTEVFLTEPAVVWVRSDVPERVKRSVLVHETQHATDKAFLDGRVWHWEFRAWGAQVRASVFDTVCTVLYSAVRLERWKLYITRFIKGF